MKDSEVSDKAMAAEGRAPTITPGSRQTATREEHAMKEPDMSGGCRDGRGGTTETNKVAIKGVQFDEDRVDASALFNLSYSTVVAVCRQNGNFFLHTTCHHGAGPGNMIEHSNVVDMRYERISKVEAKKWLRKARCLSLAEMDGKIAEFDRADGVENEAKRGVCRQPGAPQTTNHNTRRTNNADSIL